MQIRNVLVPTDFSPNAEIAVAAAAEFARLLGAGLHILHVEATTDYLVVDMRTSQADETSEAIATRFDELEQALPDEVRTTRHVATGEPATRILTAAAKNEIDLIVIATHGRRGIQRILLGSTTEKVLRTTECPVLLIQPESSPQPAQAVAELTKVVVPTDLSDFSGTALPIAASIARAANAELLLAAVAEPFERLGFHTDEQKILTKLENEVQHELAQFAKRIPDGVRHREIAVIGRPYEEIVRLDETEGAGLIVMATHGRSGFRRWLLGSVTERVSRTATCPVLIVPPVRT